MTEDFVLNVHLVMEWFQTEAASSAWINAKIAARVEEASVILASILISLSIQTISIIVQLASKGVQFASQLILVSANIARMVNSWTRLQPVKIVH